VRAWIIERFPAGFEELERGTSTELAVYTDEAGEAEILRAFPLALAMPVEPGWEDRWKQFHRPVRAGGLWMGPPWVSPPANELAVVVDPGRAFGTGAHATTRACIELLTRLERGSVLDAGCGSGVLAVAAARLGFAPVFAVDVDPVAVAVCSDTATLNGVDVRADVADVLRDPLPETDVAVANIELAAVEALLARLPARTAITSGYLESEEPRAAAWEPVDRLELDGWAADVLARRH
jgi:ribosomal protein L11 methyltransferase